MLQKHRKRNNHAANIANISKLTDKFVIMIDELVVE